MPTTLIDLEGVTRTYHLGDVDVHALAGVDLRVESGEFLALMGASGSGKSTLMNILGCLDRPSSGRYLFEGLDVAERSEPELARIRSERIGFVFQSFNLLARTSALENVALPLFYSDSGPARRSERRARARQTLASLGLAARERNTPSQLSGGQQQRVAIARALINVPGMILADEPTGNLDSRTSNEIMEVLRALNRDHGVTIVVVTHDPGIAAYTDRIVTMRDGRIVSDEPVRHEGEAAARWATAPADLPARPSEERGAPVRLGASWGFALMVLAAAAQAIMRNKLRAVLTMLGVFIGVAALIAMVAVGQGANAAVEKEIENLGTNLLVVLPGATTANGVRGGHGSASTLTVDDARAIPREAPAVERVSYMVRQMGQVEYEGQNWTTNVQGVTPEYLPIANWKIASGRELTDTDEQSSALVVLIGNTVAQQIFGGHEDPVGATILVKGFPLRVIAVLASKGQSGWGQDQDDLVMIPFTTAENKVLGAAAPSQVQTASNPLFPAPANPFGMQPRLTGKVNSIYVQARGVAFVPAAVDQVTDLLQARHHIQPGGVNDFDVRNLSQIAQAREGSSRIMALLLAAVASISLLVGGIGIMNILLVSVTERTREIGIRMAIGARRVHVLLQFLTEAVLLSAAGGAAGIIVGVVISQVISHVAEWPTLVSPVAVIGGFWFSAAVGIFFGYYPAARQRTSTPSKRSATSSAVHKPPFRALPLLLVGLALTTGCAVGPDFRHPAAPTFAGYEAAPVPLTAPGDPDPAQRFSGGAIAGRWWELFRSPALDEILTRAVADSPTLASARATLAQAEEVVVATRAAYYPQIDLVTSGSWQYSRSLSGAGRGSNGNSLVTSMFTIGPALTYTPDFFGHNRRLVEQKTALAENQAYQLAAAYLTLTADTVTQALTIASTSAQIKAVNDIIAADEHNLELVRIAFTAGSVARTDVLSAESQLAGDRTLLPPLLQQLSVAQHALSVLVGKAPAEWSPPDFELETLTLPGELPVTMSSELVHRRPDILAAEAQLHAASAAIGVATAQLYPSVTISPSSVLQAVGGPLAAPSILGSIAGEIVAPLYRGGALKAQQRAAVDAYESELGVYRQTLLLAFGQVADILRALQHDAELLGTENAAVTASKASLELAQDAYAAGRGSLVQVLDAQRLYAQALLGYARAKGQRYLDTILLFEAMGGDSQAWVEARAGARP